MHSCTHPMQEQLQGRVHLQEDTHRENYSFHSQRSSWEDFSPLCLGRYRETLSIWGGKQSSRIALFIAGEERTGFQWSVLPTLSLQCFCLEGGRGILAAFLEISPTMKTEIRLCNYFFLVTIIHGLATPSARKKREKKSLSLGRWWGGDRNYRWKCKESSLPKA